MKETIEEKIRSMKISSIDKYILYFFLFSFIGWLIESIYSFIVLGHITARGFLYGPICPIYGFGALILIVFLGKYKHEPVKLFAYAAITFSAFEYVVSFILEALFSSHWWNYSDDFINLNGRISIFYTFAWGVIAILFINYIYPFIKKKVNACISKAPIYVRAIVTKGFVIVLIADTIISSMHNLSI